MGWGWLACRVVHEFRSSFKGAWESPIQCQFAWLLLLHSRIKESPILEGEQAGVLKTTQWKAGHSEMNVRSQNFNNMDRTVHRADSTVSV